MKRFLGVLLSVLILGFATNAMATKFVFQDTTNDWPGYTTDYHDQDYIGGPDILRVKVFTNDDGYLKRIKVVYDSSVPSGYFMNNLGDFSSLFIQSQWNQGSEDYDNWDYYLQLENTGSQDPHPYVGSFYQVGNYNWAYTYATNFGDPNTQYRKGHPAGIATNAPDAYSLFVKDIIYNDYFLGGPTEDLSKNSSIVYKFQKNKIFLGDNFVIGTSMWCANDVTMTPAPVPEPGTLLLVGSGLFFLATGWRRKYRNR